MNAEVHSAPANVQVVAITETACRKCHTELTGSIDPFHTNTGRGGLTCTSCHNEVGHIE